GEARTAAVPATCRRSARIRFTARRSLGANWRATAADSGPGPTAGRTRGSRDSADRTRAGSRPPCTTARPSCRRYPGRRSGGQRRQYRPGAVDVIGAPAAEPAAVRLLLAPQIIEALREARMIGRCAGLGQHSDAAGADIGGWRIEQRAVVRKRDVVQVEVHV